MTLNLSWTLCRKHFAREFRAGLPRVTETWVDPVQYGMVERGWHGAEDLGAERAVTENRNFPAQSCGLDPWAEFTPKSHRRCCGRINGEKENRDGHDIITILPGWPLSVVVIWLKRDMTIGCIYLTALWNKVSALPVCLQVELSMTQSNSLRGRLSEGKVT